jgi:3-hydroxyisobutyrate dehydrogenase
VLAEVFTMGVKAGVEPLALWEAIRQGATGRQRTFDRLGGQFLQGRYDPPDFALRLLHKDVSLALQLGREVSVPMRLCNLALQEMTEAMNRGWAARDSRSFMLLQQERSGIAPLAVPSEQIRAVQEKG